MTRFDHRATILGVEYRVLGPLSAYSNGEPAKLGGKRQQMVLAVLLSTPNQVVSQDTLIDYVWAGLPPESAIPTLHSYVSNLRRVLGGGPDREGSGYIVRLVDSSLDSVVFDDLSARARVAATPAETLEPAEEALRLWHGRAFGDLGDEPALIGEARRLEEMRLATLETRIEADIAVGNHLAVIQELGYLTAENPYRERLRGFLMLALYRAGRQADALRVFGEARRFLGDELGIEPSPELQILEEQILVHDPSLDFVIQSLPPVERAARGYELREKLRDTPFGALYRGFQGSVGREVAVLKLSDSISEDAKFVRRFETEMRAASELDHPHLVPIFDFWRDPDGSYLVTALPRGGTFRETLVGEPWNISSVIRFVDQVGSALSYIHRNGFVHGALTMESVLLDQDSNAFISDLGLAGLVPGSNRLDSQVEDVAALARLAFALLTGSGSPDMARLSDLRPDLGELDAIFERASHPDEASRYQKPEDFGRALRLAVGGDVVPALSEVPTGSRRNPYKGLRAFKESEATDFHGRDLLVEDLVTAVATHRLVAVVGPSGSGKSSLVRAGLLPALRSGAIPGSENWLIAEMFPGTHPFEELEAALVRVAVDRPPAMNEELTSDDRGLVRAAKKLIGNDRDELVVLVDQFEELFSLVSSETNRRLFLDSLTAAANDERSRLRFILTLRADFFDQPLQYPEFGEVLGDGLIPTTPPSQEGLTRAIAQPARNVGVDLQPGLVTRIIDDVRDEPGGLPLMQYALTELFNNRVNNTMTLAAYEESGGVAGALANRADEIYGALSDEGKATARNLFLRLVNVDEMADDTRRRVRQTELRGLSLNQAVLEDVIQQFGAFRLLSFDRDAATRTPTVEVAHEALIREWNRLHTWIDDRREDLLIHRRMQVTARDWEDSEKDPSYLLRGSRLEQALVWQERTDIAITDDEMTFIEASIEQEKRDLAEHAALEAKVVRRRKAVIGVLAGGLVVAGVLGAIALERAGDAQIETARATAQELSAAAHLAIEEDPELAVLLSLEAIGATVSIGLEPEPAAISALRTTQRFLRLEQRIDGGNRAVGFSPDGATVVLDDRKDADTGTTVVDVETGRPTLTLDDPPTTTGRPAFYAFSSAGDVMAVSRDYFTTNFLDSGEHQPEIAGVDLYTAQSGAHVRSLMGPVGVYSQPTFSQSGLVAAAYFSGTEAGAIVWDVSGSEVRRFDSDEEIGTIYWAEFLPGTDVLMLAYTPEFDDSGAVMVPGRAEFVDPASGVELRSEIELPIPPENAAISPDGTKLAIASNSARLVEIIRLSDGAVLWSQPHSSPQQLAWHPDSSLIAVSGNDSDITILDIEAQGIYLTLTGHEASIWGLSFSPNGEQLASASLDGAARIWNVTPVGSGVDRGFAPDSQPSTLRFGSDGSEVFIGVENGDSLVTDSASGRTINSYPLPLIVPFFGWATRSLQYVFGVDFGGNGQLINRSTMETLTFPPCHVPRGASEDGNLVVLDTRLDCLGPQPPEPSHVLDIATGEPLIDLGDRAVWFAEFSENKAGREDYLVVNLDTKTIEAYRLSDGALIGSLALGEGGILNQGFLVPFVDATGQFLGIGTNGTQAIVVDMDEVLSGSKMVDAIVFIRRAHKGNAPYMAPASNGTAISSAHDGFYRMWDIKANSLLWEIRVGDKSSSGFSTFMPSEDEIAYIDVGGVVRITPVDNDVVIERARAALTRALTDDECTQYLHTDGCEGEQAS